MSILRRPTTADPSRSCCPEYAAVSRRGFIGGAAALAGATSVFGSAVLTASPATAAAGGNVVVVLSLRGAADGLSLVVPHGDPSYYAARPKIGIAKSQLIGAYDPMFGLHPSLAPLLDLQRAGKMATIHAAGLPVANRSHFSAMEELEDADPGSSARVGWLNRLVGTTPGSDSLQGFAISSGVVPTSLTGPEASMSAGGVDSVKVPGMDWDDDHGRMRSLHTLWDNDPTTFGTAMRSAFGAVDAFAPARSARANRSAYPNGDLGDALSTASQVIRGDVGVEVITVDHGDWDMHVDLGTPSWGRMQENAGELARGIAAFFADLGPAADRVTLVTLSEFGRRVRENSNNGLDHGYGNVMMAFGAGVKGGYYGSWPGLSTTEDADLLVTTDYRDVLADVVSARFATSIPTVFPGLVRKPVGIMRT